MAPKEPHSKCFLLRPGHLRSDHPHQSFGSTATKPVERAKLTPHS